MMNEILFGVHYKENDSKWIRIQDLRAKGIKEILVSTPVNFLPWLRFLIPRYKNTLEWMIQGKKETHLEYAKVINETSKFDEDCICGFYIKEKEKMASLKSPDLKFFT